jgi:energy-coupling factor transporter ATP-binding protein EcfA2
MTSRDADLNPFSTARVRPGALAFEFPPHESLEGLWERFVAAGERGQILGPHGSGKSTLLRAFALLAERRGRSTVLFGTAPGQQLPRGADQLAFPRGAVVLVDSYEQLGFCPRRRLRRACRRHSAGLLVTSHREAGLPTLWRTEPNVELLERLVEQLLAGFPPLIASDDVRFAYERHGGDIRESLFRLYDLYESRRRRIDQPPQI